MFYIPAGLTDSETDGPQYNNIIPCDTSLCFVPNVTGCLPPAFVYINCTLPDLLCLPFGSCLCCIACDLLTCSSHIPAATFGVLFFFPSLLIIGSIVHIIHKRASRPPAGTGIRRSLLLFTSLVRVSVAFWPFPPFLDSFFWSTFCTTS